jgi:hypothetical protein
VSVVDGNVSSTEMVSRKGAAAKKSADRHVVLLGRASALYCPEFSITRSRNAQRGAHAACMETGLVLTGKKPLRSISVYEPGCLDTCQAPHRSRFTICAPVEIPKVEQMPKGECEFFVKGKGVEKCFVR